MPIWDINNAGTTAAIGKIWDMNNAGTTAVIGKVWDINNAGTTAEVFSAETVIYDSGVLNTALIGGTANRNTGGGTHSWGATSWNWSGWNDPYTNQWMRAIWWTTNKLSFAGFTSLNLDVFNMGSNAPGVMFIFNNGASVPGYSDNPHLSAGLAGTIGYWARATNGILTVPLASYQSSYFVAVCGYVANAWNYGSSGSVRKIWLE